MHGKWEREAKQATAGIQEADGGGRKQRGLDRCGRGARTVEGTWRVVEFFSAAPATVPSNQCRLEPRQDVNLSDPSIRVGRR